MPAIHLVQLDIAWEDKAESRRRVRGLLESADVREGDLIVLPEMFETGFSMHVDRTADDDGASAAWLADLARESRAWTLGGITIRRPDDGKGLNRCLVFEPGGAEAARYDKLHPFSYGKEAEHFVGGERVAVFDWPLGEGRAPLRIGLTICYDLRFPELYRAGRAAGAEAFTVIANWPAARHAHWETLLRARAIENQAIVLGVNRAGADPFLEYAGGSAAIDAKGETLRHAGDGAGVVSLEAGEPADAMRAWRERFPAWGDAKPGFRAAIAGDGWISG